MQQQQYKRIYNLGFALFVICSGFFAFTFTNSLLKSSLVEGQKEKYHQMCERQRQFIYNEMVKAGKREEADRFRSDPQASFLGLFLTNDEKGEPFGPKANALDKRIRFCEENLGALSIVTLLIAYAAAYFLFWYVGFWSVRYVKGQPAPIPASHSK